VKLALALVFACALSLGACSGDDADRSSSPASGGGGVGGDAAASGGASGDAGSEAGADADAELDSDSDAGAFAPGQKMLLSADNPDDLDEDPSVVAAADGSLLIAYFSQRNGNPDIYVKRTVDGITWTEARVTVSPSADYYPSLSQDESGRFHLTWFRWTGFQIGSIWYTSTLDPTSWDPAAEEQVTTTPDVDDWVPTFARTNGGDSVICFASEKRNKAAHSEIYLSRKPAGASGWLPPAAIPELESDTQDDTVPILARTGDDLSLVWVRCDPGGTAPCLSGSADLFRATSSDATTWSAPEELTSDASDATADALPSLYVDQTGVWWTLWISAPPGTSGQVLEAPLSNPSATVPRVELEGYSPHVAATQTPGVFLGAWVESVPNQPNQKDVYYRFFSK
jgi:hypothetical protein